MTMTAIINVFISSFRVNKLTRMLAILLDICTYPKGHKQTGDKPRALNSAIKPSVTNVIRCLVIGLTNRWSHFCVRQESAFVRTDA